MPYIKKELREELEYPLGVLSGHLESMLIDRKENRAGVLNYVITSLIDSCYGPLSDAKYKDYNEAIGMLECCKLEFYRKAAAPYEDLKERENGSVLDGKRVEEIRSKVIPDVENNKELISNWLGERNLWILIGNALIKPFSTNYRYLYINDVGQIQKGYSGIMEFGCEVCSYSKNPSNRFSKETINSLNITDHYIISNDEIAYLLKHKISLEVYCQDIKLGLRLEENND